MEDYKNKYNEALERFRAFKEKYYTKDTSLGDVIFDKTGEMQKDFESIFPELRESDNERIINQLITLVNSTGEVLLIPTNKEELVDWLKKQKEQKPVDYDHEMWKNCEANFEGGKKEVIEHPERYGLQKPAEWSEEDADMLNCCISSIEEVKENRYAYKETDGDTSYDREIDWLKSLRPSWKPSEEQGDALVFAIKAFRERTPIRDNLLSLYNDLKKL